MAMDKVVALVAGSDSTRQELASQLHPLLGEYVNLETYTTSSGIHGMIRADLVVITSRLVVEEASPFIHPDSPRIVARRTLNLKSIDKLFDIPQGTTVLLVNDAKETAEETIDLLREIGIDHLKYVPYYPNCDLSCRPKTAITPGESALAPSFVENIIDLGSRVIDLTTIVEILARLGLLDEKAHRVSAKYMETIIRLSRQLHSSIDETNRMNNYLVRVLNQVNDGIMAFSKDGIVTVFNEKCEELFNTRGAHVIGRSLSSVVRRGSILDFLSGAPDVNDQLFRINGADVVINKFTIDKLESTVCTIKNTRETIEMENRLRRDILKRGYIGKYRFTDVIGSSPSIRRAIETAKKLARTDSSILIYGESGVGKELFASSIHNESPRANGPFLAVNFSALPEDLVESELFGYEEGAFTGAKKGGKIGLFEQAAGGTIFLDEIGDTAMKIQARLLRVLQEREIMRVGGTRIIPVNVRVIAATNKNLGRMCREGEFREDLYYRLKKLYLEVPPLRSRVEDIDELVGHFLSKNGFSRLTLSKEAREILLSYHWPGNVRELENTIEYMISVCEGDIIDVAHLPRDFFESARDSREEHPYEEILGDKGDLDEFVFILRTIHDYNKRGKPISRREISRISSGRAHAMTEEQVRHRTDVLADLGLLVKPKGPAGMRLRREGLRFLEDYNRNRRGPG